MLHAPAPAGLPSSRRRRAAPLIGVVIGSMISLLMWAMIVAIVFAVR